MKRLTYRDSEGRAQWMPELLEDYEDAEERKEAHE